MEETLAVVKTITFPKKLTNSIKSALYLSNLWLSLKGSRGNTIYIDLKSTVHIEGNMCAALGIILERIKSKGNAIIFRNIADDLKSKFYDNNFLPVKRKKINLLDENIQYKVFEVDKFEEFKLFMKFSFYKLTGFDSAEDIKKLVEVIGEIYANIKMHTDANKFSICGEYLIADNILNITVANIGMTIPKKVQEQFGYEFNTEVDAFNWALKKHNSTRIDEPGGLGFHVIRDYVKSTNGSLIIVSGRSYWQEVNGIIEHYPLKRPFPGTYITLKLDVDKIRVGNKLDAPIFIELKDLLGGDYELL